MKYTKPQALSYTPAIKISDIARQPDKIVVIAEEKEEIFLAQAFPSQAIVVGDISFPDSAADVSAYEIREALFT